MKPYSDYSAEELAMENLFIRWVRFPDDPSIGAFWENWIIKYPSMKATVDKARELVLTASDWKPDSLSNQEVNSLWGRIRTSLDLMVESEPSTFTKQLLSEKKFVVLLILILLVVLMVMIYLF